LIADAREADIDAQWTGTIKLSFICAASCEQLGGFYRAKRYFN
jgi:hypothetical protein